MPKEKPCSGKHSICAASTKNAKDKSNSTTLLALHKRNAGNSSGQGSCCSSEKDSGYSDGSDWQQTDAEDQRSNKSQSTRREHEETSVPVQNQGTGQENPGILTLMPAGRELSSIYIINNMVLKQPDMIQKKVQMPRRNGSRESSRSDAARKIPLQQPGFLLAPHQPSSHKSRNTGKMINGAYLPILNSYPRIAPHPSKKPPDQCSPKDEAQNLSKRVSTEHKSQETPVKRSPSDQHLYKQPKLIVLTSSTSDNGSSSGPTSVSSSQSSTSESSLYTNPHSVSSRAFHRNGGTSARHRRFLNTVEILKQSDLLDITLRTKELLRQSNATDRDIAQLRQHTELLWQAAGNPGMAAWEHLHRSMTESGSYPHLNILQNIQIPCPPDSVSQTGSVSSANGPHDAENFLITSQNRAVPQQSHLGQARQLQTLYKSSEKVTFVPPDSSTG